MAELVLRVTPETLEKKANEFTSIVNEIKNHFGQIESIALRTRGHWIGEAGDKDRAGYVSYTDEIDYIIQRLQEHPRTCRIPDGHHWSFQYILLFPLRSL